VSDEEVKFQAPKFCTTCGTPNTNVENKFCAKCGSPFKLVQIRESKVSTTESDNVPAVTPTPYPSYAGGSTSSTNSPAAPQSIVPSSFNPQIPHSLKQIQEKANFPLFNQSEKKIFLYFSGTAYFSHIMRYFFIYNRFPNYMELLFPIPFYFFVVFVILGSYKHFSRNSGVAIKYEADNYDYSVSFVMSSFFASILSFRSTIDKELCTIADEIPMIKKTRMGMIQEFIPSNEYIGSILIPKNMFYKNLILFIVGIIFGYSYWNFSDNVILLESTFRLVGLFIVCFNCVELSPIVGKQNATVTKYGRIRTLLLFFGALILLLFFILGKEVLYPLLTRGI